MHRSPRGCRGRGEGIAPARTVPGSRAMSDAIIYSSVSQVSAPSSSPESRLHALTVSASLAQGQTVLAEFTAKSGNFLNVVQRILKNLNGEDTEVTYQYGE